MPSPPDTDRRLAGSEEVTTSRPVRIDPGDRRRSGIRLANSRSTKASAFLAVTLLGLLPIAASAHEIIPLHVPPKGAPGFTLVLPASTGVDFTNRLSDDAAAANQIRLNGSGVALGDVDGDGRIDVFLCGLESDNRLFLNRGGWRFEPAPITGSSASIALRGKFCTGAALADLDGDGDLDLLVNALGEGTRLFLNDGTGGFTPTSNNGLESRGGATSMALADADADGDLDLYVTNYRTTTIRTTGFALLNIDGKRVVPRAFQDDLELTADGKVLEHGEPDCFYLNDGSGQFLRLPWTTGGFVDEDGMPLAKTPRDWGLSVMFRDIDQDGRPDLYVCNDFHSEDRIWMNVGGRQFRALPRAAVRHTSTFSMGVDFADLDRDGWDEFFLSDMLDRRRERRMSQTTAMEPHPPRIGEGLDRPQYDRNTLHWNRGDGSYAEIACFAGLDMSGWSWSTAFVDVDLDGLEDLLMTTGHLFDTQDLDAAAAIERGGPYRRDQIARNLLRFPRLRMPKMAFRNQGTLRFTEAGQAWGFADIGVAHGMGFADLDGDGDMDVVVNNLGAAAGIYRNNTPAARVLVSLRGQPPNTRGIGARVGLLAASLTQFQEIQAGGRYLSSDAPQRTFAWPTSAKEASLRVAWPSGRLTSLDGVRPNHLYILHEPLDPAADPSPIGRRPEPGSTNPVAPLFVDISDRLGHVHVESVFDDLARQPLLPRRLSQPGPGIALHDLDGDGSEELILGAGRGGRLGVFRVGERATFAPLGNVPGNTPLPRDATAILPDPSRPRAVLVALSNYEDGLTNVSCVRRYDFAAGTVTDLFQDGPGSIETLSAADADGDGDLDVLIAGRCQPGRYPEPGGHALLRNDSGSLVLDRSDGLALGSLGLVSAALWRDFDGDGTPELAVATEWGALRLFRRRQGRLTPWDPAVDGGPSSRTPPLPSGPLSSFTGWWTTLAAGDFDGDGRTDLLAGNWGLNSPHRTSQRHPVRLWYGDFDESGSVDLIETEYDSDLARDVPIRDLQTLRQAVPALFARFSSHARFAAAGIEDILGAAKGKTAPLEAVVSASLVLLNRGERWEARPLPDRAQWTPIAGADVADVDGDGDEDVFLAQNFFAVHPTAARHDAGTGMLLLNDGSGHFTPASPTESGIRLHGEQRGCAFADLDRDGRPDLVVGQNGASTRVFLNRSRHAGSRIRLVGPAANPLAIGAAVRLVTPVWNGPVREIGAGGRSLSSDSTRMILGVPRARDGSSRLGSRPVEIEVRWPDQQTTRTPVSPGAAEVTIRAP